MIAVENTVFGDYETGCRNLVKTRAPYESRFVMIYQNRI